MEKDCYQEIIAEVSKKLAEKFRPVRLRKTRKRKELSRKHEILKTRRKCR